MADMFRLAMVAVVASVSAMGSAEAVVRLADHRRPAAQQQPAPLRAATVELPSASAGAAAPEQGGAVMKASDGHFWADGEVNGKRVRFLVDTGATAVALTPADAQRLGVDLASLQYGSSVTTAAGKARAAAVRLATVSVAGARLENVDALVIDKGLDASLLGMSYLGRLSSFQATRKALFLRP